MSISASFGFRSFESAGPFTKDGAYKVYNVLNVLGYFPVLGIITGIIRYKAAKGSWQSREIQAFNRVQVVRGVTEAVGAGLLFLIPDIIVSIGRLSRCLA